MHLISSFCTGAFQSQRNDADVMKLFLPGMKSKTLSGRTHVGEEKEVISDILPVSEVPGCVLPGGAVCKSVHEKKHRGEIRDRASTPVGICRTDRSVCVHVCVHACATHRERERELVCRSSLRAASRMCALGCDR